MRKCRNEYCGAENPSSAAYCMKCGRLLVDEDDLTEEQKLHKELDDTIKENEMLKAALSEKLKGIPDEKLGDPMEDAVPKPEDGYQKSVGENEESDALSNEVLEKIDEDDHSIRNSTEEGQTGKKLSNKTLFIVALSLFILVGIVGGLVYYFEFYLPAKRDAEAPRYYVCSTSLKIRNSPFFDGESNIAGRVSYGAELIVYDSIPGDYYYCKFCPHDATGKVIKDQIIEGYVHYDYLLPKDDFFLINSILGNDDAKKMLAETRYKKALLHFFKDNDLIGGLTEEQVERFGLSKEMLRNANGRYQVFCRDPKAKSNNVYRSRKYRPDSKYPDAAIILDNIDNRDDRLLLYFVFDDDESSRLIFSSHIKNRGYMKDGTLKLCEYYDGYGIVVEFVE